MQERLSPLGFIPQRFFYMDTLRRKIHMQMIGRKEIAKAVSLSLFVKNRYKSSTINNFTYKKLSDITGLSVTALRKRVSTLKALGYVQFIGSNREHLLFCSLSSKTKHRNIDISYFKFDNIRDLDRSVFASFLIEIQRRKDFARHMIQTVADGKTIREIKSAKRSCRRYGYGEEYHEYGISLRRIAKDMGLCIKTSLKVIKWAIRQNFITKEHNQSQRYVKGIGKTVSFLGGDYDFTFCTKDNEYYIFANTYCLTPRTAII